MGEMCRRAVDAGIECVIFGDLFLEEIRAYRERMLAGTGLEPVFPLWDLPTASLAREMIAGGLRARLALSTGKCSTPALRAANLTRGFCRICRQASIGAAKMASSILSSTTARVSPAGCHRDRRCPRGPRFHIQRFIVPRIVSLIASATEIVHALGQFPNQVGRSHECDFPPRSRRWRCVRNPRSISTPIAARSTGR